MNIEHDDKMKVKQFIKKCSKDVGFFSKHMCGKDMSKKQIKLQVAASTKPHSAAIFSRQSGKSTALAIWCLWMCLFDNKKWKTDDRKLHMHIYAPIEDQAHIIFGKVKTFVRANPVIEAFIDEKETKWKGGIVAFRNGHTIQARSASEQAHIRGHSPAIIVIDESQDITEKTYWQDILPSGAATGARIVEAGTPKGRNHFYRHTLPRSGVEVVYQKHEECPFMDLAYLEHMRRNMPKADFDQEFNCVFQTDIGMAFEYHMLTEKIIKEGLMQEDYIQDTEYYGGLDLGKHEDATVLSIFKVIFRNGKASKFVQVAIFEWLNRDWDEVIMEIGSIIERYHLTGRVFADRLNVGDVVIDMLKPYGVMPIVPSQPVKQDAVNKLNILMENGKLELMEHEIQMGQMVNYERKKTPSGKYTFHHPDGEHDDYVSANLMAGMAMYEEVEAGDIIYYGGEDLESVTVESNLTDKITQLPLDEHKPYDIL